MFGLGAASWLAAVGKGGDAVARGHRPRRATSTSGPRPALRGQARLSRIGLPQLPPRAGRRRDRRRALLDGEGTRRTLAWLDALLREPASRWCRAARTTAASGPTSACSRRDERRLLAAFLFGLKSQSRLAELSEAARDRAAALNAGGAMSGDTLIPYLWAATGLVMLVGIVLRSTGPTRTASSTRTSRTRSSPMATTTATAAWSAA